MFQFKLQIKHTNVNTADKALCTLDLQLTLKNNSLNMGDSRVILAIINRIWLSK